MHSRKIPSIHTRVFSQKSKDIEKNNRNTFLPVINNENSSHFQGEFRPSINSHHPSQNKRNSHPLTNREKENYENQPPVESNLTTDRKKIVRLLANKHKNLIKTTKTTESPKTSPIQEKLMENNQEIDLLLTMKYRSIEISQVADEVILREPITSVMRLEREAKRSSKFLFRDRTNSCKVAVKKSLFPFHEKQRGSLKIELYFERQQEKLSTIPQEEVNSRENFISVESYSELIF